MEKQIIIPPDDDRSARGQAWVGKTIESVLFGKMGRRDDALIIKFTDGCELLVKANFVYLGSDDEFDYNTIECQLDVPDPES